MTDAAKYGKPVNLTGSVVLRARAVLVGLKANTFSSDASTNGYSTITWSSAALPPYATGYNVNYRTVSISSTGKKTYGRTRAWLKNTKAKTAKLYVPAGSIYQVLATVADSAPIKAGKPVSYAITASPVDDRALLYSSGWSSKRSPPAYKGTVKYSAGKGRTATQTVYGSSIRIIGAKCPSCGAVTVTVDGKNYSVSSYAASTRWRQTWFATNLPAGRHSVKITVAGTKGRSAVWLDGVGVTG